MQKRFVNMHIPTRVQGNGSYQIVMSSQIRVMLDNWALTRENTYFANYKGTDQSALSRSLVCVFVIGYLDSILATLALCKIARY